MSGHKADDAAIYGLDHGKLNIQLPPATMWMNMGYWRDTADFPTACEALLVEILKRAGLADGSASDGSAALSSNIDSISILDLGFGCGEQTLSLLRLTSQHHFRYVGITLNRKQFQFAETRLRAVLTQHESQDVKIYCADAARPETWDATLSNAVRTSVGDKSSSVRWALALDTLYHFSPSRTPIFKYAAQELGAGIMAFDILQSETATALQRALLKVAAKAAGCPSNAFVTEAQYRHMLIMAGYAEDDIEIHDITAHVFGPLSGFMARREAELGAIGLKMGGLRYAGKLFGWVGKSNIVKGVIVIARRKG